MRFVSYAQNFEDVLLWRALHHIESGFYIDVGAQSPVVDSVSQGFYEKGWRGCHVEPTERYASELRQQRPDEPVFQVALGASDGTIELYEIADTGLSTTMAAIAEKHAGDGRHPVRHVVPQQTLDKLFEDLGRTEVHWMKIDVEGAEAIVLQGWRESVVRPWILVIEATRPGTPISVQHEWEQLVLDKGYARVYFDGLNSFFVSNERPELAAAFQVPVNIFDDFELSGLASSPFSHGVVRQLTESRQYSHNLEANRLALLSSASWRITAPLRAVWSGIKHLHQVASGPVATVTDTGAKLLRTPLVWCMQTVLRYPRLAAVARQCLSKVPTMEQKLAGVALREGMVSPAHPAPAVADEATGVPDEALTGWARRIHCRMQALEKTSESRRLS